MPLKDQVDCGGGSVITISPLALAIYWKFQQVQEQRIEQLSSRLRMYSTLSEIARAELLSGILGGVHVHRSCMMCYLLVETKVMKCLKRLKRNWGDNSAKVQREDKAAVPG